MIGDGEQPDAGRVGLADELGGLEDAVGAERVGVEVRDGVARGDRLGPGSRRVAPGQR